MYKLAYRKKFTTLHRSKKGGEPICADCGLTSKKVEHPTCDYCKKALDEINVWARDWGPVSAIRISHNRIGFTYCLIRHLYNTRRDRHTHIAVPGLNPIVFSMKSPGYITYLDARFTIMRDMKFEREQYYKRTICIFCGISYILRGVWDFRVLHGRRHDRVPMEDMIQLIADPNYDYGRLKKYRSLVRVVRQSM